MHIKIHTATRAAERFSGASVSVFKGCVTSWGGRWPTSGAGARVCARVKTTYSWKPEVIRTLLPISFAAYSSGSPRPGEKKKKREKTRMNYVIPYSPQNSAAALCAAIIIIIII